MVKNNEKVEKVFFLSLKNDRRIPWSRRFVVVVVEVVDAVVVVVVAVVVVVVVVAAVVVGDEIDFAWQENVPGPNLMNTSPYE